MARRRQKIKITTLCDPLWFSLPYHDRILQESEKVLATLITERGDSFRSSRISLAPYSQ